MRGVALVLCLVTATRAARAEDEINYDLRVDVPIVVVGGVTWIISEVFKNQLAPSSCRWCERNLDGTSSVNGLDSGVREALRWSNTGLADTSSHMTAFVLAPASALGLGALAAAHDDRMKDWPIDALMIMESVVIAADINQLVKYAVARERPFVNTMPDAEWAIASTSSDSKLSFYSGHTSLAFSLAVSSGTVASMRGYRLAPVVWATGLTLAVGTGYLRMAADKHYFTDVLTGAVIGSAVGFAVPYLRKLGSAGATPELTPVPGGATLGISGTW